MTAPAGLAPYTLLRRALFHLDAERAHELAMGWLRRAQAFPPALAMLRARYRFDDERLRQTVCGIDFPNPVGLAAGFDKNGEVIHAMAALGFGFVEIGTVTPKPQAGNPKPRLFRLPAEASLQNAMGFNNDGMDAIRDRLTRSAPFPVPVGINVGKNKDTPEDRAADDYLHVLETMANLGDYYVVNVSSPNTPGLRDLQNETFIETLLNQAALVTAKPIFLKLSPDADAETLVSLARCALDAGASGIIATNTTVDYTLSPAAKDFGGISGRLLQEKSRAALATLSAALGPETPIISSGGVDSPDDAWGRLRHSARLVQIYTGLVYQGPGLARDVNRGIVRTLEEMHLSRLAEWKPGG